MQPDYFGLLENVILEIDNVPSEVQHVFTELQTSNTEIISFENRTKSYDIQLRKLMRADTLPLTTKRTTHNPVEKLVPLETTTEFPELTPDEIQEQINLTYDLAKNVISNDDQVKLYNQVQEEYTRATILSQERIELTEKITEMLDKHIKKLDSELLKLEDGDVSVSTPIPTSVYTTPAAEPTYVPPSRSAVLDTPVPIVTKKKLLPSVRLFPTKNRQKRKLDSNGLPLDVPEADEQLYCTCQQVSYGEMIACDNKACSYEWFHLECVSLNAPPTGVWYCKSCAKDQLNL